MSSKWIIGLTVTILMASAFGCANKRPATAAVPSAPAPTVSALPAETGASHGTTASGGNGMASEATLEYDRVVVPPLQPAQRAESPGEGEANDSPAPASSVPGRSRRPTAVQGTRTPEPDAPGEPEAAKPTELRAPSLKPMISDAERRAIETQMNSQMDRARKNLGLLRESRLGQNEKNVMEEARSFLARAEQLRSSDPVLANSLAERAAILTQELLRKQ